MSNQRNQNPGPDPHDPSQKELLAEESFFGEPDALRYQQQVDTHVGSVREAVIQAVSPTEQTLRGLQEKGILPESPNLGLLARTLDFLGRMGIQVMLEDGTELAYGQRASVELKPSNLAGFLRKGAVGAAFLLPLTTSAAALAELVPGASLMQQGAEIMQPGIDGNVIHHWEVIVIGLLVLLGLGAAAIAIVKKLKKSDHKLKVQKAKVQLKAYDEAKKAGDPVRTKKAKEDLMGNLMGELPEDMGKAVDDPKVEPKTEEEMVSALEYKKQADDLVSETVAAIEAKMVLPEITDAKKADDFKEKVVGEFEKNISKIERLLAKLGREHDKLVEKHKPNESYEANQIAFEQKKLQYILNYIKQMQKLFLILAQELKDNILAETPEEKVKDADKKHKKLVMLKEKLHDLLDNQSNLDAAMFEQQLQALDQEIDDQERSVGITDEAKEVVKNHELVLYYEGLYNHETGICLQLDEVQHSLNLAEDFESQIWVNQNDGTIGFNLTHKGAMAFKGHLTIVEDASGTSLQVDETKQNLAIFLAEKQAELRGQTPPAHVETAENADIYKQIAKSVAQVSELIKHNDYEVFGKKVDVDDEAIKHHLVRVHREFHGGAKKTVVRFTLSDHAWKAAVAGLKHQHDVPKNTISFKYESESGLTEHIGQQMIQFNVFSNGKKATVLIPQDSAYLALQGEVRIIFDPNQNVSEADTEAILHEVTKRLSIEDEMKPVTPAAEQKLQAKLLEIRRGNPHVVDQTDAVHPEYEAKQVAPSTVENLRKKGLHSVYHQFSMDTLEEIFRIRTLLSSTTRWSKGVMTKGMSSTVDHKDGGATEVFTRIHTKHSTNLWYKQDDPAIVFPPEVLERLDCYCYKSDKYGSKLPDVFSQRISPEQLVDMMMANYDTGNEIMFFDALDAVQDAAYIVCKNNNEVNHVKSKLTTLGITSIGGKPLHKAVITRDQFSSIQL